MPNDNKQILLSTIVNVETLSYVRNQDEKVIAIDITDNEDFNKLEFTLQANVAGGLNPKSQKTLEEIESFVYIYSPFEITGEFTKLDGSKFTINIIDILIMRESFTSIVLKNPDTANSTSVKAIFS